VQSKIVRGCRFLEENGDCRINFPYTNSEFALLIRQENSDIAFPSISAKDAEMDGAP
jgi:hypothetical protein